MQESRDTIGLDPSQKTILVVGFSVRAMVESAVGSGYKVIALDAFGDRDTRALTASYSISHDFSARYSQAALLRARGRLDYDLVAYTSSLENHPWVIERFARLHPLIGNCPRVVRSIRSWESFFCTMKQAGFNVPENFFTSDTVPKDAGRRWLVKPRLSGGGRGIAFYNGCSVTAGSQFIQEYIPGKACSASFVADGCGCVVLGITEQLVGLPQLGSGRFAYCGNILPLSDLFDPGIGPAVLEEVNRIAAFLTRTWNLVGLNGFDFILKGDRVYTIEVNPRYSASMELMEKAYSLPMFHFHVEAALRKKLPDFNLRERLDNNRFAGKGILFAGLDAVAPDTAGWHRMGIRDIPGQGEALQKGNPICTILAMQPSYDEVVSELFFRAGILQKAVYGETQAAGSGEAGAFSMTAARK
ncbi:MAG TPA: ATP-grasp domain-containing protein [Acidobacteriota bacterium]|nr:ATP-grasp domain-containing protein [Acidobacteriota bacterium]